jgi:hypothetical protein
MLPYLLHLLTFHPLRPLNPQDIQQRSTHCENLPFYHTHVFHVLIFLLIRIPYMIGHPSPLYCAYILPAHCIYTLDTRITTQMKAPHCSHNTCLLLSCTVIFALLVSVLSTPHCILPHTLHVCTMLMGVYFNTTEAALAAIDLAAAKVYHNTHGTETCRRANASLVCSHGAFAHVTHATQHTFISGFDDFLHASNAPPYARPLFCCFRAQHTHTHTYTHTHTQPDFVAVSTGVYLQLGHVRPKYVSVQLSASPVLPATPQEHQVRHWKSPT